MLKRCSSERLEYYKKKIKKLEKKQRHRLRVVSSSDSDTEECLENDDLTLPTPENEIQQLLDEPAQEENTVPIEPVETPAVVENSVREIEPNILAALGEIADDSPELGEKIRDSLSKIWTPLLKKGLTKENRESLMKKYLIPENCSLLQAPSLNPEIQAAITESGKFRDIKFSNSQQQLGGGITAVNRGLNLLVNNENSVDAIKFISDGCRILCDLHYQNTETRIKFIVPCLDKSYLQCTEQSERDNTLFGTNFAEKIKAAQSIVKQGQQIRKTVTPSRPTVSNAPTTSGRSSFQGNGSGPSRYPTNRGGGRGGHKRMNYRAPPASTPPIRSRPSNYKHRVPTRR